MTNSDNDAVQPDATVAFGRPAADTTERDERPGMAPAQRIAADAADGVLPPLATTEFDVTPVRQRFASGGK